MRREDLFDDIFWKVLGIVSLTGAIVLVVGVLYGIYWLFNRLTIL